MKNENADIEEAKRFDQIAAGHRISAAGRDIPIDPEDPQEGVWIDRRPNALWTRQGLQDRSLPPRSRCRVILRRKIPGFPIICLPFI